jgi:hypothetical protein
MEATRRTGAVLALVVICAAVAGCGASPSTSSRASATATATALSSATSQPTVDPAALTRCPDQQETPSDVYQAGDFLISKPLSSLTGPAVRLPDQTPLKPLQVPLPVSNNALGPGQFAGAALANPGILSGSTRQIAFVALLCNDSASQAHVLQSVSVRIADFAPFPGQILAWPYCDMAFSRQHPNVYTGGCGGGYATEEQVQATFASGAQTGTTVLATQTGYDDASPGVDATPLPLTIAAGKGIAVEVVVAMPDMQGTYTFSIGFQIDGAPTTYGPPTDTLIAAPVAHTFTGASCNTSTMLAQIPPATTPETYYICPQ